MCQDPPCVLLPPHLPPWDVDCLDALWKVGRADEALLWNKCSRVQGLQLEKTSGEAALREVLLWCQWEGAAKKGVFVWSGETWAQNRGRGKAWPQSCLCFSENQNWESLKACVRPRLIRGKAGAGKPSLFSQATDCKIPMGIPVLVRPVRTNAAESVQIGINGLVWEQQLEDEGED